MPFMVPLTLTGLVEPKKATDPGQFTHAQLPRTSMVAVKVFSRGVICPIAQLPGVNHHPGRGFDLIREAGAVL